MELDDRELMQRIQNGQVALFDELVRRYRGPLQRVAANKLGDSGRAEDVVQETFLAVYASRQTYNPEFGFRTWLWTILLNLCRRELAKQKRRPNLVGNSPSASLPTLEPLTAETGLSRVLQVERSQQLLQYLSKLTDVQADAIRLRFFGELKYREIAQAMGCSEITAKVRVRNGLTVLSRMVNEEMGESHEL